MGGVGDERDVSLQSGDSVAQALKKEGVNVVTADVTPQRLEILEDKSIDVFFLALHGTFGEDGQLQEILEKRSLVYTGSRPAASRVAFDKAASKKTFAAAGVSTPAYIEFNCGSNTGELIKQLKNLGNKYVIKPTKQGSSVGITITGDPEEAIASAKKCLADFGECIIEKFMPGMEITAGILCGQPLPLIEIRAKSGFYDYHAKYADNQTEYLFDTIKDPALEANIKAAALDCFSAIGCRHFARVDFILSEHDIAYALEINTIPGFTTHSLLPKAAAKAGFGMGQLCMKIIKAAMEDKEAIR